MREVLNRLYWGYNPWMLFQLDAYAKRDVYVTTFGPEPLSVSFRNADGTKGQICSPGDLRPLLKNLGAISSDEVEELVRQGGFTARITEVGKSRANRGFLNVSFITHETYKFNIYITGTGTFEASEERGDGSMDPSISFNWKAVVDYLRTRGYNMDYELGDFIDVTPKTTVYASPTECEDQST